MMGMNFGEAIERMRKGERVYRQGWNGKNMWIAVQMPDANSKMTAPYIYMRAADGRLVPWLASQTDMLSLDWYSMYPDKKDGEDAVKQEG